MVNDDKLSEIAEFGMAWRERHPLGGHGDPLNTIRTGAQDGKIDWAEVSTSHDDGRAMVACHPAVMGGVASELLALRAEVGELRGRVEGLTVERDHYRSAALAARAEADEMHDEMSYLKSAARFVVEAWGMGQSTAGLREAIGNMYHLLTRQPEAKALGIGEDGEDL